MTGVLQTEPTVHGYQTTMIDTTYTNNETHRALTRAHRRPEIMTLRMVQARSDILTS